MNTQRTLVNFGLRNGLRRLHCGRLQRGVRAVLDEVDLDALASTNTGPLCPDRTSLYMHLQHAILKDEPIDFLEFGVYKGDSLRQWSDLHRHSESRFVGFDSFEGLPHDWRVGQDAGHFSVNGSVPIINDARVSFVKGWFNETIPSFIRTFQPRSRMVIHLDADLYSSTMWALVWLTPWMRKGTLLIFDEFYDRDHEFKAFRDWSQIARRSCRLIGRTDRMAQTAFLID